jgi:hypothetical protein
LNKLKQLEDTFLWLDKLSAACEQVITETNVDQIEPFELINLDYGGSLLYSDRVRIDALEVLINKQRPLDFLLLITSNIREFDPNELECLDGAHS